MPNTDAVIRTKLRPPLTRAGLVSRPRLQEQIAQGLRGPLTLITAPAGFGKTTLVASSIAAVGPPVAWLSLDKNDNLPGRFLVYLVAALQAADARIGREVAPLLAAMQPAPADAVLAGLINDLDVAGTEIALVLDDYQFISAPAVHEAVAFLLDHGPHTFHLVIATRSDPPLPLSRWRARGQTVELRAADLRFTAAEAAQFLSDVMGIPLNKDSVALLAERTEGWIAGLQMAALSMRGRDDLDAFIRAFAGTHRFIMDFMLEEVLAREPEEVHAFLLQTAILTRLTGPLCDAVTGAAGGQEMLEQLEKRNLFLVALDDDRRWYRYHHLFADLLQARLYQSGPERVAPLLSRAAAWCERDGQVADAVGYALAAQDYPRAAGLIATHWHVTANRGEIETVWSWLAALPREVVRQSAPLGLACCWVLWLRGDLPAIEPYLVDTERALSAADAVGGLGAEDAPAGLPAHLAVLRSIVARYHHDYEAAVAQAERALRLAPPDLPPWADAQLRTVIYLALSTAYDGAGDLARAVDAYGETIRYSRLGANAAGVTGMTHWLIGALWLLGRLRAAEEACRAALRFLEERGMAHLPVAGLMYVRLGELSLERNDLQAAEEHLERGAALARWSGRFDAARNAAPALVRLRLARGDALGALAAVGEAEAALGEQPAPLSRAGVLALRARVLVGQGALAEAAACIEEAARLAGPDRGHVGECVALAASRLRLARGGPEAVAGLARSLAAAEACGRWGVALELRILHALALARQGDAQGACAGLERALALAEPEGYRRLFLDEGRPMRLLLAQWLARAGAGPRRDYAVRLLGEFDHEPQAVAAPQPSAPAAGSLVEPLTPREREVLHLMSTGSTNQAIAQQLVVSPGTVKAHTASIYRKLDVANRTEAVARARQLGILP